MSTILTERALAAMARPRAASVPISRRGLLLVFLLAVAVRIAFMMVFYGTLFPPSPSMRSEMEKAAMSLAANGTFGNLYGESGPTAMVGPLYPAVLSVLYGVWGPENLFPQQLLAVLATAATIALVPVLGRRLGLRPGVGWVAAVCLALLPVHWIETDGRWEQPLTGLVLVGTLLAAAGMQDYSFRSSRLAAAFGLLMAVGGLLAPQTILPAGVIALLGAWLASGARASRLFASTGTAALTCALAWVPWTARNYVQLGGVVPLRSNFGLELRLGNSPGADGGGGTLNHTHPFANEEQAERLRSLGELAYMREQRQLALDWIEDHPSDFARLCAHRVYEFWLPPAGFWQAHPRVGRILSTLLSTTGAASLIGLVCLIGRGYHYRWLLLAGLLGPSLVCIVTHLHGRYRYPIFGISLLLACEMAFVLACRLRRSREANTRYRAAITPSVPLEADRTFK